MTNKNDTNRKRRLPGQPGNVDVLPTGYEGENVPDDFFIPSCGITDIDRAMFKLFNEDLNLQVGKEDRTLTVPVIFAGGERFALVKSGRPIRDKRGLVITPIISIQRESIDHQLDNPGMGLAQDTGDLIIKKSLSNDDREYQNLVNKLMIKNQDNLLDNNEINNDIKNLKYGNGQIGTVRPFGNNLGDNIFEIIAIPFPTFFVANYNITIWTQYMSEMTQIVERIMTSFDGQGHKFRIETNKGYWFVATLEGTIQQDNNFTEYTEKERIIKATMNFKVPAFMFANKNPGDPVPFRKYTSAPKIDFDVCEYPENLENRSIDLPYLTSDDEEFILNEINDITPNGSPNLTNRGDKTYIPDKIQNPFTNKKQLINIKCRNLKKGETIYRGPFVNKIDNLS